VRATRRSISDGHRRLFDWIVRGGDADGLPRIVEGFVRAQTAETSAATAELVRSTACRARRSAEHLTSPRVWAALLDGMPSTALIRNLATMTRIGLLTPGSRRRVAVGSGRRRALRGPRARSRCCPPCGRTSRVAVPAAGASGLRCGDRRRVDAAFYAAFAAVESAGPAAARARRVGLDAVSRVAASGLSRVTGPRRSRS
jgi:60 kDa SS-A/Ro ribonucleoprotein